jgi:hypothetical protein
MVPFFVLMAVLYGALNAALDTTAGERERGSLEPLLMNPLARHALVLGKWGGGGGGGMLIAVLACLSFLPGQWLLRSESLAALFRSAGARRCCSWRCCCRWPARWRAADGGGHPLPQRQGGAGQRHGAGAGGVAAADGDGVQPGRRGALAPVGAGAGAGHADGARAQGRPLGAVDLALPLAVKSAMTMA